KCRPAAVLPGDDVDTGIGQRQTWIDCSNPLVIPACDLTEEYVGVYVPFEPQLAAQAFEVIRDDYLAGQGGNQLNSPFDLRDLFVREGCIAGPEIDLAVQETRLPFAAAYEVINDGGVGMGFLVLLDPLFVQRCWKGGPGSVDGRLSLDVLGGG